MRKSGLHWAGITLTFALISGAFADVIIYRGAPISESRMQIMNWGSGKIEETEETRYTGSRSLKISTVGAFAGGWLVLEQPIGVQGEWASPNKVLQFAFRFPNVSGGSGSGLGGPGGPGGLPGPGGPGGPGGLPGPGGPGGLGGPGASGSGSAGGGSVSGTNLSNLRVIIETTDSKRIDFLIPLDFLRGTDISGWRSIGVALSAIPGLKETNGQIARIGLFGDLASVFYVGEIRVTTEEGTLKGFIVAANSVGLTFDSRSTERIVIAANDELIFQGMGEGGSTPLVYRWNFGDGKPNEVDAEAKTLRRRFPKPGIYTVTLTVADAYNLRPSVTSTITVQVN